MKVSKKDKRRILFLGLAIVILSAALVTSVIDNLDDVFSNKKQIAELEVYYEELIGEEESLKSEVTKLSDPDYLARYAKERYLYSEDGEIIIRFE